MDLVSAAVGDVAAHFPDVDKKCAKRAGPQRRRSRSLMLRRSVRAGVRAGLWWVRLERSVMPASPEAGNDRPSAGRWWARPGSVQRPGAAADRPPRPHSGPDAGGRSRSGGNTLVLHPFKIPRPRSGSPVHNLSGHNTAATPGGGRPRPCPSPAFGLPLLLRGDPSPGALQVPLLDLLQEAERERRHRGSAHAFECRSAGHTATPGGRGLRPDSDLGLSPAQRAEQARASTSSVTAPASPGSRREPRSPGAVGTSPGGTRHR